MHQNYYQVLGVPRAASRSELRNAYVRLAKRHHPDLAPWNGVMPQRLREVQQAYRCLSDAERRAEHDQLLDQRERLHMVSQRAVQRRLRRYDNRHPHPIPHPYRRMPWRWVGGFACGFALVAGLSVALLG